MLPPRFALAGRLGDLNASQFLRNAVLVVIALLFVGLPARAQDPASPDGPPLPWELNCALSYQMREVAFDWFDTSDGWPNRDIQDQDIDVSNLPFTFIYFGVPAEQVGISDNGWISIHEGESGHAGAPAGPLPSVAEPHGVIAPHWADFDPEAGSTVPDQREIQLKTFGSEPDRVFVVTWNRMPRRSAPASSYTFQVALYERTHAIRFQYLEMVGSALPMSIGIEDQPGNFGYQYAFAEGIELEGKAVEFRPSMPSLGCDDVVNLSCGDLLTAQEMSGDDGRELYGCGADRFLGSERLYRFSLNTVTLVDLLVTPEDPAKNLRTFVMTDCDLCNCTQDEPLRYRTALGPGDYYVVVEGVGVEDNGPFDIALECRALLGEPTGSTMQVADPDTCGVAVDMDRFADGRGVWTSDGWLGYFVDTSYSALRVDGSRVYATNPERSACAPFTRMAAWADDNTDTAVAYWQAPEVDVVQTIYGREKDGCCGVQVVTEVINRDSLRHYYEFRSLFGMDFAEPQLICLSEERVGAGPLHVEPNPGNFAVEQNLTCGSGGICALDCATPAELKSSDDLQLRLVAQYRGDTDPAFARGEWIDYFDVDAVCAADPWLGGMLPGPEPILGCDMTNGLLYATRLPRSGGELRPGDSDTVVQLFGDACRLDPDCTACFATADLIQGSSQLCLGQTALLDGSGSLVEGCSGGGATVTYEWLRDGEVTTETGPGYLVDEPAEGEHTYTLNVSCQPPPGGVECADSRRATIGIVDCAGCSISAQLEAEASILCMEEVVLDATGTLISDCPGVVSWAWTRQGVQLVGQTYPTLRLQEPESGFYEYTVTVTCESPLEGLDCQDSTRLGIFAMDCSSCSIEARIEAPDTELSVGESTLLDAASLSTVTSCPGTLTWSWFRDGEELVGQTSSTLSVAENQPGDYEYTVSVTCSPPPTGLDCQASSPPVTITFTASDVPDLGNTLLAVKSGEDVALQWGEGAPALAYNLLRGESEATLIPPGPPVVQTELPGPSATDPGAAVAAAPYYYRVRGVGPGGVLGPY